MELMELYHQIKNPLDDPLVIEKLIKAYANSGKGLGGFYGQLTKTVDKEHNKGQFYLNDSDEFYSMMFNKWKNSILALTKEQFIKLYRNGSYGLGFVKMREYLKSIPDVKTKKEVDDIFFGKHNDKELANALNKYRWTSFGEGSGWIHVCSRYVTAKQDEYPNIEHRLYLNTESLDTYKMVNSLVKKCDRYHLPYYFKFDQYANRDDTIVIYSSTENLMKYIEILKEIKNEYPDLVKGLKEPPLLTGKIDNWIGYGSEPIRAKEENSFNKKRSILIEKVIDKITKKWIVDHINIYVLYKGQKLVFYDYVAMKLVEKLIDYLEKRFGNYEDSFKKQAQSNGTIYNQNDVVQKLGYSLSDIKSQSFKESVFKIIREPIYASLKTMCNGSGIEMNEIKMNVRNGKQIYFGGSDLEEVVRELSVKISQNDPNYMKNIHSGIIINANRFGIDPNKFCFDIDKRERMNEVDSQRLETFGHKR